MMGSTDDRLGGWWTRVPSSAGLCWMPLGCAEFRWRFAAKATSDRPEATAETPETTSDGPRGAQDPPQAAARRPRNAPRTAPRHPKIDPYFLFSLPCFLLSLSLSSISCGPSLFSLLFNHPSLLSPALALLRFALSPQVIRASEYQIWVRRNARGD